MQPTNYSWLKQQAKQNPELISPGEQIESAIKDAVDAIEVNGMEVQDAKPSEPKQPNPKSDGTVQSDSVPQESMDVQSTEEDVSKDIPKDVSDKSSIEKESKVVDPMVGDTYDFFSDDKHESSDEQPVIQKIHPGSYRERSRDISVQDNSEEIAVSDGEVSYPDENLSNSKSGEKSFDKSAPKYRQAPRNSDGSIPTSVIKNVPTDLLNYVKSRFRHSAPNNSMVVAACLYAAVGFPQDVDVPEDVKIYANEFISDSVVIEDVRETMLARFNKFDMTLREMQRKLNDLEIAAVYSIFDKLGFRSENSALTPGEVDFLEIGTGDLRHQLEKQSRGQWEREMQSKGRPIK